MPDIFSDRFYLLECDLCEDKPRFKWVEFGFSSCRECTNRFVLFPGNWMICLITTLSATMRRATWSAVNRNSLVIQPSSCTWHAICNQRLSSNLILQTWIQFCRIPNTSPCTDATNVATPWPDPVSSRVTSKLICPTTKNRTFAINATSDSVGRGHSTSTWFPISRSTSVECMCAICVAKCKSLRPLTLIHSVE